MTVHAGRRPATLGLIGTAAAPALLLTGCSSASPSVPGVPVASGDLAARFGATHAASVRMCPQATRQLVGGERAVELHES